MNLVRASKFLSLVLRHDPDRVGIALDDAGWVAIDTLLDALRAHGSAMSREELETVVTTSDKQRFVIDRAGGRIRANQGHSVAVDLGLSPSVPPDRLFHGTPRRNVAAILRGGLDRRKRHAVHLSADVGTAHRVGVRRGAHCVVVIDAAAMHRDGHVFTVSGNGVWLVDAAPAEYLALLEEM